MNARQLETLELGIARYGLVIVLLWIGAMKFTMVEAMGIKPLELSRGKFALSLQKRL